MHPFLTGILFKIRIVIVCGVISMKTCILCGKQFCPTHNAQKICADTHYKTCTVCGKQFEINLYSKNKETCSRKCTAALRQRTMIDRYGKPFAQQVESIRAKSVKTNLEKFGVEHPAMSEEVQAKMRKTCQERYGVSTPFEMTDFQEKSTKTCREKYNVDFTSQIPGRTEKMQQTNLERYGGVAPMCNQEILKRFSDRMLSEYGVPYYCMTEDCRKSQKHVISTLNRKFSELLEDCGIHNDFEFSLGKYSYDIVIPDANILIEIDPTATHNVVNTPWSDHTDIQPNYHKLKSDCANQHGFQCIHIFDWDDWNKVIDILKLKISIGARKCTLKKINGSVVNDFEDLYHLQGKCRGQSVCYGLYYGDRLIEIMTFGTPRYNNNYQWELLRLCTHSDYVIPGGASRLFRRFISEYNPESVISYCDLAKFSGTVYGKIGMIYGYSTSPNKYWSNGSKKYITNNLLLQRGYDQLFNADYGKSISNEQLMLSNGWLPVYDCGQAVYCWYSE